jgi:tetratricopeptide (TPR) repeat protein
MIALYFYLCVPLAAQTIQQLESTARERLAASALALTKETKSAIAALQKAVALAPGRADYRDHLAFAWATLGDSYQQQHLYKDARDAYRQSLTLNPNNDLARNSYGNALVRSGDPAAGIREFRTVLAHDPKNLPVQVNIGFAELERAVALDPALAEAHYSLALALFYSKLLPA